MVITGVAEHHPQRIAALVYVNGVVPADGEAMVDQLQTVRGPGFVARIRNYIDSGEPFMASPTTAEEIADRWSITDPDDQAFMLPRLSPQPTLTFSQPVRTGNPDTNNLRREFILCSESGFEAVAEQATASGWPVHRIDTGHDPMGYHAAGVGNDSPGHRRTVTHLVAGRRSSPTADRDAGDAVC